MSQHDQPKKQIGSGKVIAIVVAVLVLVIGGQCIAGTIVSGFGALGGYWTYKPSQQSEQGPEVEPIKDETDKATKRPEDGAEALKEMQSKTDAASAEAESLREEIERLKKDASAPKKQSRDVQP